MIYKLDLNFVKWLEHATNKKINCLEEITKRTNLQIFEESDKNILFTLASRTFVIDILQNQLNITFVEESMNERLNYVNNYLSYFYLKGDFKMFYFIIRYLVLMEDTEPGSVTESSGCRLGLGIPICECIFQDTPYLTNPLDFPHDKDELQFNIFTHSIVKILELEGSFVCCVGDETVSFVFYNRYFKLLSSDVIQFSLNGNKFLVKESEGIFINGAKNQTMSYLFRRGHSLESSINAASKIKMLQNNNTPL